MDHMCRRPRPQSELIKPQGKYLRHNDSDDCCLSSDDAQLVADGKLLKKTCSAPGQIIPGRNESEVWNHVLGSVLDHINNTAVDVDFSTTTEHEIPVYTDTGQLHTTEVYAIEQPVSNADSSISLESEGFSSGNNNRQGNNSPTSQLRSALPPLRKRIFYSREWIFEKLLKHLRPSGQETVSKPLSNMDELDTVTETGTVFSESIHKGSSGAACQRLRIIVIVGGPGSGKTTICRRIIDARSQAQHLTQTGLAIQSMPLCVQIASHVLSAHFCYQQIKSTLDPSLLVFSIHQQILNSPPPLCELYSRVIQANQDELGRYLSEANVYASPDSALRYGVLSALHKITPFLFEQQFRHRDVTTAGEFSHVNSGLIYPGVNRLVILVDGIDEMDCDRVLDVSDWHSGNRSVNGNTAANPPELVSKSILDLFVNNAQFFPEWICLLFTCRRQNRNIISRMFPGSRRITIDDLHRSAVSHDVHQYLLSRLAVEQGLQQAFRAYMHSDVLSLLRIKSSACLLYLETLLDAIGECWIRPDQLASIPGTLNGLFLWICQQIFQSNVPADNTVKFDSVRPILEVLLASRQTLSVDDVFHILSTVFSSLTYSEFHEQLRMLRRILVTMSVEEEHSYYCTAASSKPCLSGTSKIHFFHPSFAEWLSDVKHCTAVYLCNPNNGQDIIRQATDKNTPPIRSRSLGVEAQNRKKTTNLKTAQPRETHDYSSRLTDHDVNTTQCDQREANVKQMESSAYYYYTNCTTDSLQTEPPEQTQPFTPHHPSNDRSGFSKKHSLVLAARLGEHEKLCSLLDAGADANQLDEDGWSALRTAAWRGHVDIVDLLLSRGAKVDLAGSDGRSALRAAAWAGHEEIVQRLLDAGANVDIQDAEGRSPLIAAAYMGHVGVVELIAQAGANLNHADEDGRTALHVASFCVRPSETHQEVVSCLLEYGANPNVFDHEGLTPLLGAARIGNHAVCELCLEADTDVNQTDKYDNTALSLAVLGGHTSVVRLLLFWGAAVDAMDNAGRSLLSIAASTGNASIVQELLARGLDEAHRDHTGCTPLHLAAAGTAASSSSSGEESNAVRDYCEVIRLLVESGAQLTDVDNSGRTPLLVACETGHVEAVKVLLTLSSAVNDSECHSLAQSNTASVPSIPSEQFVPHARGSIGTDPTSTLVGRPSLDGHTPLRVAAMTGNADLISVLLAAGADPDYQDAYGRTTLYLLALEGMVEMADLLLHTPAPGAHARPGVMAVVGANPVLADDEGRCPLHVATWQGHLEMVRLLLQAGTPVDIRDREGRTPLQLAAWQGHASICQILLNEGNARVDAVCSQGATSLCIAAQEGHLEVCTVLLQAGANPFQADSHGRTPYRVALKACHFEICEMLEQNYGMGSSNWFPGGGHSDPIDPAITLQHPNDVGINAVQSQPTSRPMKLMSDQTRASASPTQQTSSTMLLPDQHPRGKAGIYMDDVNPYAKPPGPLVTARQPHEPLRTSEMLQQTFNQSHLFYDRVPGSYESSVGGTNVGPSLPVGQVVNTFDSHQAPLWTTGPWQSDNPHRLATDARSRSVHPMEYQQQGVMINCLPQNLGTNHVHYGQMRMQPIGANHISATCSPLEGNIRYVRSKSSKPGRYKIDSQVATSQFEARAFPSHLNKPLTPETRLNQAPPGQPFSVHVTSASTNLAQFYPDLTSYPFHQHMQPEYSSHHVTCSPHGQVTTNHVLRTHSAATQAGTLMSTTEPRPLHPPPLPEHGVISPTKRRDRSLHVSERNMASKEDSERPQTGECSPQPTSQSSRPGQSPNQTKPASSSAKSTLAGMFGLGSRKAKKVSKKSPQPDISETSNKINTDAHNISLLVGNSPKPKTAQSVQRSNITAEQNRADFPLAGPHQNSQPLSKRVITTQNRMQPNVKIPPSSEFGQAFTNQDMEKSSVGPIQLESLARKLACCSQIEGVPKTDDADSWVSNKPAKPNPKHLSPQSWINQGNRRKEHGGYPT
ncbi:Ankyrin repeat domain-containing protein 50 [Clonorchis sinensis]|uniref:Ankyrin repeat domain-containing protein 50 n=1 Tax=Clonorchis sinensis TaxID=79923 RepID=A0A3R7DFA3_CLOSI|nr:Ankyrin repeat domain-containing protein 50 [Clonorchis sinensis]